MNQKQLSILLPSAPGNTKRLQRCLQSIYDTVNDLNNIEIVLCFDADEHHLHGTIEQWSQGIITWRNPSKYRSHFFNGAWRASTGKYLLMCNDDVVFKTKGWDQLIPYNDYPDDLVVFGLRDNQFNETFFCHPIWSRKAMEIDPNLFELDYWITKCDNVIWDIHPSHRRIYLSHIEIEHRQTPYGPEWKSAYEYDDALYLATNDSRMAVRRQIERQLGISGYRVMIGICTAEYARRADFYDHLSLLEKPQGTLQLTIHGQSIAYLRNQIVEQALNNNCTHIFFLDDDVICKPGTLLKLLERDQLIVSALQLKRNFPHPPILSDDKGFTIELSPEIKGLIPIQGSGLGACLIKTEVFKRIPKPWFRLGQSIPDQLQEDTSFFNNLPTDILTFCDTECPVGHISSMVVWPEQIQSGHWYTSYDTQGTGRVSVPQLYKVKESNNYMEAKV